jgi:hypothetical protein
MPRYLNPPAKNNTAGQTALKRLIHRRGTRILKPEMPDLQETSGYFKDFPGN